MATIKRYRYIVDNDTDINDNINNKIYPLIKVYKGNSSNQAELIHDNFEEIEEVSTDIDFTKTTFTEAEVEAAVKCNAVSNFKVRDILTISNKYCNQWVVIGKNHDGTTGTIDIMSTTQVGTEQFSYVSQDTYNPSSYLGLYAITHSYNEFTNMIISAACKTIEIKVGVNRNLTDINTYSAKAKVISCIELNISNFSNSMPGYFQGGNKEGEPYTYFTRGAYDAANASRRVYAGTYGKSDGYWTRSKSLSSTNTAWIIDNSIGGAFNDKSPGFEYGVVPIVRLGSMIWDK
jgi:hypothetical protein